MVKRNKNGTTLPNNAMIVDVLGAISQIARTDKPGGRFLKIFTMPASKNIYVDPNTDNDIQNQKETFTAKDA